MPSIDVQKYDLATPSCGQRIRAGVVLGFVVGITIGGFFGGSAVFRHGIRGQDAFRQVAKNMFNAGASFASFMGIGTALRC